MNADTLIRIGGTLLVLLPFAVVVYIFWDEWRRIKRRKGQ